MLFDNFFDHLPFRCQAQMLSKRVHTDLLAGQNLVPYLPASLHS